MGNLFGSIYCIFENFFGLDLANYMWGQSGYEQETNLFIGIGLLMLLITAVVAITYYYIIDKPLWNSWIGWLSFMVISAIINLIVGCWWVLDDYYAGKMVSMDDKTNQLVDLNINGLNCFCFGLSNMFISMAIFIIFSFLVKWWSPNTNAPSLKSIK